MLTFATLSTLMGLAMGLAKVATSLYAIALGSSETMLGLIAAAQSVGILIMSLPLGMLVERFGPHRLFNLGTCAAGVMYALVPLWQSPWFLLLCTAAVGFCLPFRWVALNTVFLGRLLTLGQNKAGWFRGTNVAGMFLVGPLVAAAAIEQLGYAGTFLVIAITVLACLPLSPAVLSRPKLEGGASVPPPTAALNLSELRARLAAGWQDAELRTACSVELASQAINAYYTYFIVAVALTELGSSQAEAAGLVAAQGLSFVVALFALGGLTARLGFVRGALISAGITVLALLCLGFADRLWLMQLGGLLLGLGLGLLQVANLVRFARVGVRLGHGQAASMNALAGPLGGFLGSLLGGFLGQHLGLQTMFLAFVPLALLSGVVATGLSWPRALDAVYGDGE